MVAPHPDLQRKYSNTNNMVMANKSEFVPSLREKYPHDYIDLDTHRVFETVVPWKEQSSPIRYQSVRSLQPLIVDRILILCVDFNDKPAQLPISTIYDRFFSNTGHSFLNYYSEVSYSKYIPEGEIHGWYRAPQNSTYYVDNNNGFGYYPRNAQGLIEDVVNIASSDPTIDWRLFDTNNNGYIDNIIIIHSGAEAAYTGRTTDFWAHVSEISPRYIHGKIVYMYAMTSEYLNVPTDPQISGVDCHEFGHLIGLPDLYDSSDQSNGLGMYSLMGAGSWLNRGLTPVHLDAWSKYILGYTTTIIDPEGSLLINDVETNSTNIKYTTQDPAEYFMIENRQKILFDSYLPSAGIFIWHINENQPDNTNKLCYLVGLIQADGLKDLENKVNYGDLGDPFPGTSNKRFFGKYTNPNLLLCNGTYKDIWISNISDSSRAMTFNSMLAANIPPPNITAISMVPDKTICTAPCNVDMNITWRNDGGSTGIFEPVIVVNGSRTTLATETLDPVQAITKIFTIQNLSKGTYNICPDPN